MSFKEEVKKLLKISKNNIFQVSNQNERCQFAIKTINKRYFGQDSKYHSKSIKRVCFQRLLINSKEHYNEDIMLFSQCGNGHLVIRKVCQQDNKWIIVNIKN